MAKGQQREHHAVRDPVRAARCNESDRRKPADMSRVSSVTIVVYEEWKKGSQVDEL